MATYIDSRIINLNSDKANTYNNGTFLSDMIFSFKSLLKRDEDILNCQIGVLNAQIPVSFYIINEYNNILFYTNNGVTLSVSVPFGNYNASTLSTYLQTTMNSGSATKWIITFDKVTGKFTFQNDLPFVLFGTAGGSTICAVLGIDKDFYNSSTTSSPYRLICPYPVNLLGIKKLKIASNALASNNIDSWAGGFCNIIATIPVNQPAYGLIQYMNQGNPYGLLRAKTIDDIDIKVFDEFNNLVDFNNVNWTVSLELIINRQQQALPTFNFPTDNILQPDTTTQPDITPDNTDNIDSTNPDNNIDLVNQGFINQDNSPLNPDISNDLDLLLYNNQL